MRWCIVTQPSSIVLVQSVVWELHCHNMKSFASSRKPSEILATLPIQICIVESSVFVYVTCRLMYIRTITNCTFICALLKQREDYMRIICIRSYLSDAYLFGKKKSFSVLDFSFSPSIIRRLFFYTNLYAYLCRQTMRIIIEHEHNC